MRPTSFRTVAALCAALLAGGPEPLSRPPAAGPARATTAAIVVPVGAAPRSAAPPGRRRTPPPTVPDRPAAPAASVARALFRWPLDGPPHLVRRFDPPPQPWLPGHRGVDLAAAPGATVRAAGPGTVLFAGLVAGRPVVTVGHGGGLRTTHEPVQPAVRPGAPVSAGAPLGTLLAGHAGCPAPACLHWGLRRGAEYLDPLVLLGLGPVRLLPLSGAAPAGVVRVGGGVSGGSPAGVSAGRAAGAAAPTAARTRRRSCRPGHRGAASRARPRP